MSLKKLVSKYIAAAEHVFKDMKVPEGDLNVSAALINQLIELARAYLQDAKYYRDKNQLEVSLASIAYCEGILDALRILGMVKFEWPIRNQKSEQ